MRLSELSAATGVSTASLKYYLREDLLSPGDPVTRTQSEYGPAHVERVRLIRALVDYGGLSLARVRKVLEALDNPDVARHDLFGVAQEALTGDPVDGDPQWTSLAHAFVAERGWRVRQDDPLFDLLGLQLKALAGNCAPPNGQETLRRWADAAELIAEADLDSITEDNAESVKTVVVGTVLSDKVIMTMRRLAQQSRSSTVVAE